MKAPCRMNEIDELPIIDVGNQQYFSERVVRDPHGGGSFAHEKAIMRRIFDEH